MGGTANHGGGANGTMGGGGLGGLSFGGGAFESPASPQTAPTTANGLVPNVMSPVQAQQPQDDLLGLF